MSQVHYTEVVIRRASRHQVLSALGLGYWLAIGLLGCSFLTGLYLARYDWFLGMIGTVLAQACLIPFLAARMRTRHSLARLVELDDGNVSIDIIAGRLRAISCLGSFDLPLSRIRSVTCQQDFWLLNSQAGVLMSIPTHGLEWSTLQAWQDELRRAGAKVK
jgi:hypothetical protein